MIFQKKSIKTAAEEKGDEDVLRDIRGVDLIAKEFQVHDKCRKDYIRKEHVIDNSAGPGQNAGKFEEVKREIEENVIGNDRAI